MHILQIFLSIIIPLSTLGLSLQDVNYRLSVNSIPQRYELKLDPNLEENNFTFTGEVKINLVVLQQSNNITLHAKNLSIIENKSELRLYSESGPLYTIEKHEYNETTDFLILKSMRTLQVGLYVLKLFFSGTLNDKNIGFYRSSYQDLKNKTVWIATTQFESTNARYAFPCYDEPALKSEFQVILKRYRNQSALSNAALISEELDGSDGKIWCTFAWTPRMSTYLVAFVIADYQHIKSADNRSRVWTKPDSINHTHYALHVGETALDNLSRYVNISYYQTMLPKMDQISIPDFRAGAMENLGAVIYRERLLLFQDGVTSDIDKQSITTVIYHEFAHQWFGNLVSPNWWNYVWLNEGFATYFEYFGTAMTVPDWRLDEQFVVKEMHSKAFSFDLTNGTHPINANVESPKEIRSIFDSISYSKAACIIRMLRHIVTEKVFRTGLTHYLINNQFGSVEPKNLWRGIQEAVDSAGMNYNISEIMDPWINQIGIPLIKVERNYTSNTVFFSQEIFNSAYGNKSEPGKWWIPLNGVSSKNLEFNITVATDWIAGHPNKTVINLGASLDDWIIINNQQTGYYRVMYDMTNWKRLIFYLNTNNYTKIHRVNRAQLIDDSFNLAKAGYFNYTMALQLIEYLKQETDYIPWYSAFLGINYIDKMMIHAPSYENFRKYIRSLMSASKKTVGFQERSTDDQTTILQRSNILKYSCYFGDSECNKNAFAAVRKWTLGGDKFTVPRNLKHVYYCASIQSSGEVHWTKMWKKYLSSTVPSDKILLLISLGCTENKSVLQRFMQLATTPNSGIRYQDSLTAILAVFTNIPKNADVALDYLMENFTDIVKYYNDNTSLSTILSGIGQRITTHKQLEKLLNLTQHHANLIDLTTDVTKSARENLIWIDKYQSIIENWCTDKLKELESPKTVNQPSTANYNKILYSLVIISFLFSI